MNAVTLPFDSGDFKRRLMVFAGRASTEISVHDEGHLSTLAAKLPAGTVVYVAHTPKASLEDVVRVALRVESLGLRASPHLVARRLPSDRALRAALRELQDGGVDRALLVAGDLDQPLGPFPSTLELLATDRFVEAGFRHLGFAGHPEGHRAVGPARLWEALRHKQEFAQRSGIQAHIVTQFGFSPQSVCDWDGRLMDHGISLPVHAGMYGPTPLSKLIKFAIQCGIGTSMHSVMKSMTSMNRVAGMVTTPDEMLVGLVRGGAGGETARIVQPHIFTFGGSLASASWLRAVADGSFDVEPDGRLIVYS